MDVNKKKAQTHCNRHHMREQNQSLLPTVYILLKTHSQIQHIFLKSWLVLPSIKKLVLQLQQQQKRSGEIPVLEGKRVVIYIIIIWYICPIINPTHNNANHCVQRTPLAPTTWVSCSLPPSPPPPLSLSPLPFSSCKVHLRPAPTHFVCCYSAFASSICKYKHKNIGTITITTAANQLLHKLPKKSNQKTQRAVKRLEAGNK